MVRLTISKKLTGFYDARVKNIHNKFFKKCLVDMKRRRKNVLVLDSPQMLTTKCILPNVGNLQLVDNVHDYNEFVSHPKVSSYHGELSSYLDKFNTPQFDGGYLDFCKSLEGNARDRKLNLDPKTCVKKIVPLMKKGGILYINLSSRSGAKGVTMEKSKGELEEILSGFRRLNGGSYYSPPKGKNKRGHTMFYGTYLLE